MARVSAGEIIDACKLLDKAREEQAEQWSMLYFHAGRAAEALERGDERAAYSHLQEACSHEFTLTLECEILGPLADRLEDGEETESPWPLLVEWEVCEESRCAVLDCCGAVLGVSNHTARGNNAASLRSIYGAPFIAALREAATKAGVLDVVKGWFDNEQA